MNLATDQLIWYNKDMVLQDLELCQFVENYNIDSVKYIGDTAHIESLIGRKKQSGQLCVLVINSEFKFSELVNLCSQEILKLEHCGFLYVALNKFLAVPEPGLTAVEDYDQAIFDFVIKNVQAPLLRYHSGHLDGGQKFNWIHPLTRFYFTNEID